MAEDFKDTFILGSDKPLVRVCANCDKENNLDQKKLTDAGWDISHGICPRHAKQMYKSAGFSDEMVANALKKSENSPKFIGHCRDLSEPKNKPYLDWLKNPPQAPHLQKQANTA